MKWCNPCALVWVVIVAACASHIWLNFDWAICAAVVAVLVPLIAVYVHQQREDVWWALQSILTEIWWLMKNRPETKTERSERAPLKATK